MERELILMRNLKNEMRDIRQRIDRERNAPKRIKMFKSYRKMSRALGGKA